MPADALAARALRDPITVRMSPRCGADMHGASPTRNGSSPMSYSTDRRSATWPSQAIPAPARPPCSKPCCMPAAQSRRQAAIERGSTVSDFDPMEKEREHSLNTAIASIDHGAHPHQPDRHPRLCRISAARRCRRCPRWRPCAVVVNAGHRHRVRHTPHDGAAPRRATCAACWSSTRSITESAKLAALVDGLARRIRQRSACRSTCPPKTAARSSTASSSRLATATSSTVGDRAPADHRPGGRDQRDA